jgi:hypothetical protein
MAISIPNDNQTQELLNEHSFMTFFIMSLLLRQNFQVPGWTHNAIAQAVKTSRIHVHVSECDWRSMEAGMAASRLGRCLNQPIAFSLVLHH